VNFGLSGLLCWHVWESEADFYSNAFYYWISLQEISQLKKVLFCIFWHIYMGTKLQVCNTYLHYEVRVLTSCIGSSVPIDMATELYSLHTDSVNKNKKQTPVRVPGFRSSGAGLDYRRYQIFWEAVGLEGGPFSLVSTTEELLGEIVAAPGL
jgi:hypothetical protein